MLVVEDEPLVRIIAVGSLEEAGFAVIEADNADHALELLRTRNDVGVLFTDVNMPGTLDGIALAKRVHELWPDVGIVVTSGRGLTEPVPDDGKFLAKPYTLTELTQVIAETSSEAG